MISTTTTTDHSSRVYNINNNNNRQPFKKVLIFFKEKVAVVTVIVAVKAVKAAVAVDVVGREPLHYGIRADRKCSALKIDFSANFHPTHDLFLAGALSIPQKLENAKMNLQI